MRKPSQKTLIERFNIVVDSREQLPYRFKNSWVKGLGYGDYTLEYNGKIYLDEICVERKSRVAELFSASGSNRERFERELEKLSKIKIKMVICEFSYLDIVNHQPPGKLPASSVYGSICSWGVRFGVPFIFTDNRNNARAYLYKVFFEFVKHKIIPNLKEEDTESL